MIIFGNRLFGKVDQVPGLGHVATRFFHIDYVPLIPYEGWLVFKADGKAWRGIKIPLSPKSLLTAWARTAAVVAGVAGVIVTLVTISNGRSSGGDIAVGVVLALAGWGVFIFTKMHKSVTRASYKRACQLGALAKLNANGMAAIAKAYGEAPMNYGFEPIQTGKIPPRFPTPVVPLAADEPIPLEEIPVDAPEDGDDDDLPVAPPVSEPARPRGETRRHG